MSTEVVLKFESRALVLTHAFEEGGKATEQTRFRVGRDKSQHACSTPIINRFHGLLLSNHVLTDALKNGDT